MMATTTGYIGVDSDLKRNGATFTVGADVTADVLVYVQVGASTYDYGGTSTTLPNGDAIVSARRDGREAGDTGDAAHPRVVEVTFNDPGAVDTSGALYANYAAARAEPTPGAGLNVAVRVSAVHVVAEIDQGGFVV
jgi:hypothetical protein